MKTYLFYPGCSFEGTGGYDTSLYAAAAALDVELKILEDWNCCGATMLKSLSRSKTAALVARNFAMVEPGSDLLVPCNSCFTNFVSEIDHLKEDAELRRVVEKALAAVGKKLNLEVRVRHVLDALVEDVGVEAIKAKVKKPLTGLTFAPYYGCQYSRPKRAGLDPDVPMNLDLLIEALGAKAAPFSSKLYCCGGSQVVGHASTAMPLIADVLHDAQAHGCDALLTICPMCNLNMEANQGEGTVSKALGNRTLPVAYFSQAIGAALGLDAKDLMLKKLILPPTFQPKATPAAAGATA